MRLALVTETWPPEINGVALTLAEMAQSLCDLGCDVDLIRPAQSFARRHVLSPRLHEYLTPAMALPKYQGLRIGFPIVRKLQQRWQRHRPEFVYIATEGPLGWAAMRAARALRIPIAAGFHTRFEQYVGHYGLPMLKPLAWYYLQRFHQQCDITLVPTQTLRDELRQHRFGRVEVLARAVDTEHFHPNKRSDTLRSRWGACADTPVLCNIGRISAEKNLSLFFDACAHFRQIHPQAKIVVIGDGPIQKSLQQQHPQVHFTGMLRGEALAGTLASCDVFFFPSLTETFGNVTLEAMASGLNVLAFDYGAAHEWIRQRDNGLLAPLGDTQQFLQHSHNLACMSASALQHMRQQARASVEGLSPQGVARQLIALMTDTQSPRRSA